MHFNSLILLSVLLFAPISAFAQLHPELEYVRGQLDDVAQRLAPIEVRPECNWQNLAVVLKEAQEEVNRYVPRARAHRVKRVPTPMTQLIWLINNLDVLSEHAIGEEGSRRFNEVQRSFTKITRQFDFEEQRCNSHPF